MRLRSISWRLCGGGLLGGLVLAGCGGSGELPSTGLSPDPAKVDCAPGLPALQLTGAIGPSDTRQYQVLPFTVGVGTGRVEVAYGWVENPGLPATPLTATTLDLGLYDSRGLFAPEAFRGWGGSRQGRIDRGQPPVFVEAATADRGFVPGPIQPGLWHVELGIAASSPQGATWEVVIQCLEAGGGRPGPDPVDPTHVARTEAGWYHGDFHMHAFHSQPNGPDDEDFIAQSRAAGLDFLMVTEYVMGRHWETLGAVQRQHPDLLIWPGREIITYFGHANTHGETPSTVDYRHGFEGVTLGEIQRLAKADGALFQVNHPTIFPGPVFQNLCRGCEFELDEAIDWSLVDTVEVLTGPIVATGADIGLPLPGQIEQPFVTTAIWYWEDKLRQGHKITAVSGSDSKGVDAPEERGRKGYGSSATVVFAEKLSRPALRQAILAGHAYVRTRGVNGSPEVDFEGETADGQRGIYGDVLRLSENETALLRTTVRGGEGQRLSYYRNGRLALSLPVTADPFVHEQAALRVPAEEGPLGSFWRIELHDGQTRTIIGNPIFLQAPG